jgi:nibrin
LHKKRYSACADESPRIKWNPVALSFSYPSRLIGGDDDPIVTFQYRLEPLDIKTLHDYVVGQTSHVVAGKRNTAKGLQALVNAKPIVTEAYIDTLVSATTRTSNPVDPDNPLPSHLESDFDGNWPNESAFVPSAGKEPFPRPATDFQPNADRNDIFKGFTFVFLDSAQFEQLQDFINDGHGKALLYEVDPPKTTVEQVVEYVTNVSGYEDIDDAQSTSQATRGVVVIRLRAKGKHTDYLTNLQQQVDLRLGLRSVEQNEFLDVILQNDVTPLRRPLMDEEDSHPKEASIEKGERQRPSSPPRQTTDQLANEPQSPVAEIKAPPSSPPGKDMPVSVKKPAPVEPAPSGPSRRRGRRGITTSRFKGFDDFDVDDDSNAIEPTTEEPRSSRPSRSTPARSTRSKTGAVEVPDSQSVLSRNAQPEKRPLSPSPDRRAALDDLLPGAKALKRRRLEQGTPDPETAHQWSGSEVVKEEPSSSKKHKKTVDDIDYNALLRSRRQAEDDAAKEDEEALKQALEIEGLTLEDMKKLVQVEEMPVPARTRADYDREGGAESSRASDARWNEQWNGRKNFKGFKRRGQQNAQQQRREKVFVPMEEVKKKGFGFGSGYWNDLPSPAGPSRRDAPSQSQRVSSRTSTQDAGDGEEQNRFRRRRDEARQSRFEDQEHAQAFAHAPEAISQSTPDVPLGEQGMDTQRERSEQDVQSAQQSTRTQTQSSKSKGKRPAREEPATGPPTKRQSRLDSGRRAEGGEEEGDGLKFRFRRKRKD